MGAGQPLGYRGSELMLKHVRVNVCRLSDSDATRAGMQLGPMFVNKSAAVEFPRQSGRLRPGSCLAESRP